MEKSGDVESSLPHRLVAKSSLHQQLFPRWQRYPECNLLFTQLYSQSTLLITSWLEYLYRTFVWASLGIWQPICKCFGWVRSLFTRCGDGDEWDSVGSYSASVYWFQPPYRFISSGTCHRISIFHTPRKLIFIIIPFRIYQFISFEFWNCQRKKRPLRHKLLSGNLGTFPTLFGWHFTWFAATPDEKFKNWIDQSKYAKNPIDICSGHCHWLSYIDFYNCLDSSFIRLGWSCSYWIGCGVWIGPLHGWRGGSRCSTRHLWILESIVLGHCC